MTLKALSLALTLAPALALAQDELGLDLSEAKTPPEFRPAAAFVGVTPDASDEQLAARARLLEAELLKQLNEAEMFSSVKTPGDVAAASVTARKCADYACLEALGEKLGVHRIVTATVSRSGPATLLVVSGFDKNLPAVLPMRVESGEKAEKATLGGFSGIAGKGPAQRDKEFLQKVRGPFAELLRALSTPLGKLSVDVIEQRAVTRLKGRELGTGSFERLLPVGSYEVEVAAGDEYQPFAQTVTIEPLKRAEVKVTLVAKPVELSPEPLVEAAPAPVFYKRPGVYVALVGAVVMGVGFAFGGMAKGTENRAVDADHDGYLDITRAQANAARTQALLANVFVATGAVAFAAGLTWFFITPLFQESRTPPPGPRGPASPGDPEGSGFGLTGLTLGLGSSF